MSNYKPFDTRQSLNRSALSGIGSSANTTLDTILSDINTIFVNATSAPTASVIMKRDANANTQVNSLISNLSTTATAAGTTTLTVASSYFQQFTGTTTQTVVLPNATTLSLGQAYFITNRSTGNVTVNANDGSLIQVLGPNTQAIATVTSTASSAGAWDSAYSITSALNNPMTTLGDLIYGGASGAPTRLANGTTGQLLMATVSAPESWATVPGNATVLKAPTIQTFVTPGWNFRISTGNTALPGSTYTTPNGATFTNTGTLISSSTQFGIFGPNVPDASGTLTKTSGSGSATIAYTSFLPINQTYTPPSNPSPLWIRIRFVGGGGGGSAGANSSGNPGTGTSGTATVFNSAETLTAGGGLTPASPALNNSPGGVGGTPSGTGNSTTLILVSDNGASGSPGLFFNAASSAIDISGAMGGSSFFGGAGIGGMLGGNGGNAVANTGSGGGGKGVSGTLDQTPGAGGGAGAYMEVILTGSAITATPFQIGGGGFGSGGNGNGANGRLIVEENYQ